MTNKKLRCCQRPRLNPSIVKDNANPLFPEYPAFCFAHVTTNKRYNFSFFSNDMRQEIEARQSLDGLLEYLSQRRWLQIIQGSKTGLGGYEALDYSRLKFSPKGCVVSDDEKVSVIRFGKNDSFRLIGQWKEPVFYVFGYDFDYSAYNHGS